MAAFSVCTVVTRDRFAYVRVLANSIREHHRDATILALVVDPREHEDASREPFDVVEPADVGVDRRELERRAVMYSPFELTGSFRAPLLRWALAARRAPALYLDCDIRVYGDLTPLVSRAAAAAVVLSPHEVETTTQGPTDADWQYLAAGAFNSGFLGVGEDGEAFLDWWAQRTARHCLNDPANGQFVEQRWLSLAPAYFATDVCRDPGANVMGWRLHRHDVDATALTFMGGPLRFFHFCGRFDPRHPDRLTTMPELRWPSLNDRPGTALLCRSYARELLDAGFEDEMSKAYAYATLPDGRPIDHVMRRAYRTGLLDAEAHGRDLPPNPFTDSVAGFMAWLGAAVPGGRLSRYHHELWSQRLDLQIAFPAAPSDSDAFAQWITAWPEHLAYDELRPQAPRC